MHGPWRRDPKVEAEDVAAHRPLHLERRLDLRGDGEVPLAAELERLERDGNHLAVLIAEP